MSLWVGLALFGAFLVLVEVLNVFLGLWSDRFTDRLRRGRQRPEPRFPWSNRTRT